MSDTQDQTIEQQPTERVTRRDLAEGKIEKVMTERTAMVPVGNFGLRFENAMQMAESAKLMSTAGPLLPPWLQGNPGGCWAIILRSQETGISPLTLAGMTFVTEKKGVQRIGYDSSYFRTLVEMHAPIKQRLEARYEGEGDDLICIVYATFKGESEPRQFPPKGTEKDFTLKKLHPGHNEYGAVKGSPLWDDKPPLQMFYAMSRDWARMFCADIVAGVYSRDELIDAGFEEVTRPTDLSPRLSQRLRGPGAEGFRPGSIKSIEDAIAEASPGKAKKNDPEPFTFPSGSEEAAPSLPAGTLDGAVLEEKG